MEDDSPGWKVLAGVGVVAALGGAYLWLTSNEEQDEQKKKKNTLERSSGRREPMQMEPLVDVVVPKLPSSTPIDRRSAAAAASVAGPDTLPMSGSMPTAFDSLGTRGTARETNVVAPGLMEGLNMEGLDLQQLRGVVPAASSFAQPNTTTTTTTTTTSVVAAAAPTVEDVPEEDGFVDIISLSSKPRSSLLDDHDGDADPEEPPSPVRTPSPPPLDDEEDEEEILPTQPEVDPELATEQPIQDEDLLWKPDLRSMIKICSLCGTSKARYRCSSCQAVWYCSESHQVSGWAQHKSSCESYKDFLTKSAKDMDDVLSDFLDKNLALDALRLSMAALQYEKYNESSYYLALLLGRVARSLDVHAANIGERGDQEAAVELAKDAERYYKYSLDVFERRVPDKYKSAAPILFFQLAMVYAVQPDRNSFWEYAHKSIMSQCQLIVDGYEPHDVPGKTKGQKLRILRSFLMNWMQVLFPICLDLALEQEVKDMLVELRALPPCPELAIAKPVQMYELMLRVWEGIEKPPGSSRSWPVQTQQQVSEAFKRAMHMEAAEVAATQSAQAAAAMPSIKVQDPD